MGGGAGKGGAGPQEEAGPASGNAGRGQSPTSTCARARESLAQRKTSLKLT